MEEIICTNDRQMLVLIYIYLEIIICIFSFVWGMNTHILLPYLRTLGWAKMHEVFKSRSRYKRSKILRQIHVKLNFCHVIKEISIRMGFIWEVDRIWILWTIYINSNMNYKSETFPTKWWQNIILFIYISTNFM